MEKNIKGFVQQANGGIPYDEWAANHLSKDTLRGDKQIQTTFGLAKQISEWQGCFVFTPKEARGTNGVMLIEFLGISDLKEMLNELINGAGFK